MPPPAAPTIETLQVMTEGGDDGISFPYHALFFGFLVGAGATAAFLADAGLRLGAALHRRSTRRSPDNVTAQPNPARARTSFTSPMAGADHRVCRAAVDLDRVNLV